MKMFIVNSSFLVVSLVVQCECCAVSCEPVRKSFKIKSKQNKTKTKPKLAYRLILWTKQEKEFNRILKGKEEPERSKNEKSLGLAYVALSRVKRSSDLSCIPFPFSRLDNIKKSKNLPPRIIEEARLKALAIQRLQSE